MELLLSYEASCNSADDKGSSPLHLAAWAGHAPIVDILLTRGPSIANVNLTVNELSLFGWPLEDDLFPSKGHWASVASSNLEYLEKSNEKMCELLTYSDPNLAIQLKVFHYSDMYCALRLNNILYVIFDGQTAS